MKLNCLLIIGAVMTLVVGLTLLIAPAWLASLFGVSGAEATLAVVYARLWGAAFLGFSALNWLGRNVAEGSARQAIILSNLLMDAIGFVVTLIAQLANVANVAGWIVVALYLLFALGFGWFAAQKPPAASA